MRFCWVPGHAGVEGNEFANSIAETILKKGEIDVNISLGRVELRGKIKKGVERE